MVVNIIQSGVFCLNILTTDDLGVGIQENFWCQTSRLAWD